VIQSTSAWSFCLVEGTSEKVARVMRKHQVPVAMRPVKTLKSLLVHPKDKQEEEEIIDCVCKIPCASCEKCYIGETGRKFGTRLKEHKTEVESITSKPFTRNQRASNLSALDGSKRQYIFEKSDNNPLTRMRAATRRATRTTDFLPRHITIVARTGRRTEQASSDEGL